MQCPMLVLYGNGADRKKVQIPRDKEHAFLDKFPAIKLSCTYLKGMGAVAQFSNQYVTASTKSPLSTIQTITSFIS